MLFIVIHTVTKNLPEVKSIRYGLKKESSIDKFKDQIQKLHVTTSSYGLNKTN